ncbi:hypothetical protein AB8I92_004660 [Vibrio alginolyticus]
MRLYRGQDIDNTHPDKFNDGKFRLEELFTNESGKLAYQDIAGLCKVRPKLKLLNKVIS